jgi:ABC-type antimicrobial peptide transport system permease subunit
MNYFTSADMGFSKEAIVHAAIPGDSVSRSKMSLLRDQLLLQPSVRKVSFSAYAPVGVGGWATDCWLHKSHGPKPDLIVQMKPADTAYFSLYQLQLLAGRVYQQSDTIREFVVNEKLLKALQLGTPQEAIGKNLLITGTMGPIVGVVKDFHTNSLREPLQPVVMTTIKLSYRMVNIKIAPGKAREVLAAMGAIWNKTYPDYVFEYNFIDDTVAAYYHQEKQLAQLYQVFAGIAVFISCLGLYGLISFMAVRRKKEIGIRKVLGAPAVNILLLLSREFTLLITLAFFIAAPVAWYWMHQWLQQYAFRIHLGMGFFLAAFLASVFIAWLTVGYTVVRAASANPVNSLHTE